jgi:gamma-glutamyltranspeptidase/glutathione hydrolase/leukotriene-C4 hydrolase
MQQSEVEVELAPRQLAKRPWNRLLEEEEPKPPKRRVAVWMVVLASVICLLSTFGIVIVSVLLARGGDVGNLTPTITIHGAVAADTQLCSEAGVSILQEGGNAIDAAVATCLCQGVVSPVASGIGGGAVILIRLANGSAIVINAREQAPGSAYRDMYTTNPESSRVGGLAVAVPGELKGLEYAWRHYGSGNVTWARLFDAAIRYAREGVPVSAYLADAIKTMGPYVKMFPGTRMVLTDAATGELLTEGALLRQPKLASTLQRIADSGSSALFYTGALSLEMVQEINSAGGNITQADFASYTIEVHEPVSTYYHGYKILSASVPFGGPLALFILNLLELYNFATRPYDVDTIHLIIEAFKWAFSNRMVLGDPAFVNVSFAVQQLLSKDHAARIRSRITLKQTFEPSYYEDLFPQTEPNRVAGTSHLSVVDSQRNAVALTTTVNLGFGSKVCGEQTGIWYNNEMDDFSTPNVSNGFNLPPSEANFIAPFKRPLSSMTPTIVLKNEQLWLSLGASGGPTIITSVVNTLLQYMDFGKNIKEAIYAPRFHHQLFPNVLLINSDFPRDLVSKLQDKGHSVVLSPLNIGVVQGIALRDDNVLTSASDFRKGGSPAGY